MSRSGVSVPAASRGWRAAILLLLLWVGGGCLFSTRDPQTPAPEGGDSSFRDPTVPDTVLRNIRFAIRQENVSNYSRSLADSFTFVPDPDDAALIGEDFFANWSRDQDQTVFSTIFTQADSIRFAWGESLNATGYPSHIPDPEHSGDRYYQNIRYIIRLVSAGRDTLFSGKADLFLRQYATEWRVRSWEDKRDDSGRLTLGRLRGNNGQIWN